MLKQFEASEIAYFIQEKLLENFGRDPKSATKGQLYKATCWVLRDIMSELWKLNYDQLNSHEGKQVFYLSMEFLPGPSLHNNAFNLHLETIFEEALKKFEVKLTELYEIEPDAGLGNGGLGRLASCYLDALSTNGMPGHGMSICYEYGIFRQKFVNGQQTELPDDWLNKGDVWLITKEEEAEEVHFGGSLKETWDKNGKMSLVHEDYTTVIAIPKDMLITGYDSDVVNTLRLWKSTSPITIDMKLFAQGNYLESMEAKHMAEVISKILYPEDAHLEGKLLRMKQQYFFIAASMQFVVKRHFQQYKTLDNFAEKVAIHINDTHPTMAIPELLRIFIDDYHYEWDIAWEIVKNTISYTNHTVMPEALEKWPEDLFRKTLPRIHSIVIEINRRQHLNLLKFYPEDPSLRNEMAIIQGGELRMANLCVETAHTVNGVSTLHSSIIQKQLFSGFAHMTPDKFTNVTNGIAYRRWLCQANPKLSALIESLIGPEFKKNAIELERLWQFQGDHEVSQQLFKIKKENKNRLASYIKNHNNVMVNTDSIFDVQVKRLHEYKRQLMNLLHILYLYNQIKENPNKELPPRTFIFAAKAAAGYYMAKEIIRFAHALSKMLERDPATRDRIRIVFLENYTVSLSELIMPAAEVSEQISLAGKEASGTGNMKLMINGALTIGTEDGANVEIHQAVGNENIFIFGMKSEEVEELLKERNHHLFSIDQTNETLSQVIEFLSKGIEGEEFQDLFASLTTGYHGCADPYFIVKDFEAYRKAQEKVGNAYQDQQYWNQMSLANIASAGIFSADRAVREYANRIWNIKPIHEKK